jgi:hypothetical protein
VVVFQRSQANVTVTRTLVHSPKAAAMGSRWSGIAKYLPILIIIP